MNVFLNLFFWVLAQRTEQKKKKLPYVSAALRLCRWQKPVESSPAAAPPPFVRTSPTHLLYHVERRREHSRRCIKWTDDLIPSKKTCLSFINRCSNFMSLLRDWSPGSDPHDCHDCSVLHGKDDMQNETHRTQIRLILSSTMICLLSSREDITLLFHHSHYVALQYNTYGLYIVVHPDHISH